MLYAFTNISDFSIEDLKASYTYLSKQRIDKVSQYKYFKDQRLSALAYLLLRYALITEYNIEEYPEFTFGEYGKPFLKNDNRIFFNMSHSNEGILCGVSENEIGVDITDIDPDNLDCFKSAMHLEEQEKIKNDAMPAKIFSRYWALKESYLKCIGVGIGPILKTLNFAPYGSQQFTYNHKQMQTFYSEKTIIASCSKNIEPINFVSKNDILDTLKRN